MDLVALPKTELHLHLEGAIPPPTLLELIHKYGGRAEVPTAAVLENRLRYRDFDHFLSTWKWMATFVREVDDFAEIARTTAIALAARGVTYAELFFSPPDFRPLELQPIARAVRAGLDAAGVQTRFQLIVDLCRQYGPQLGARWLAEAAEVAREVGIVGIGLGGPEHRFPPEVYASVYRRAAELGLRRVAHAGEAAPPPSVWGALRELGAERIGHGIRAVEDPALVEHLRRTGIPLEICPTSNVCTAVVAGMDQHPIRRLFDSGVRVTLSSDDPTFFGCDIVSEYQLLRDQFGFTDEELIRIARTGFEVAFVSDEERRHLLADFDRKAVPSH